MQLYFFDSPEHAIKSGVKPPDTTYKDYAMVCILHKKKVITLAIERKKYLGMTKDLKPADMIRMLNAGIREMSRLYPELRQSR